MCQQKKRQKKDKTNIPEKNCAISSFEQPNGSPRSLTQPSSIAFSKFRPLRFTTHSISDLLALNTETDITLLHLGLGYYCNLSSVSARWVKETSAFVTPNILNTMWDLGLSQQRSWQLMPPGMWCCVLGGVVPNVLKDHDAFIFGD
jgi:hypothetical protein